MAGTRVEELASIKTLRLQWRVDEGVFTFTVKEIDLSSYKKRRVLSRIANCLISFSFLALYVIRETIAMQEASLRGFDFFGEFPGGLKITMQLGAVQLAEALTVKVPRCY